jgi:DNA-binding transcriptional LysR family regulator
VREALKQFRRLQPGGHIRLSTLRGQARIEGVSSGTLDLAIVTHDISTIREISRRILHVEPLTAYHPVLACATGSPWERSLRGLPKSGAPVEALADFPLILPEPDSGLRRELDVVLRRHGLLDKLALTLEIGGWPTILAYVRDGFGVGVVSEAALDDAAGLTTQRLDPSTIPPIEAKLICRELPGSGHKLALSESARLWRDLLLKAAKTRHR